MARPSHGVVSVAALDLRRRPDHRSELKSQLLTGEVVRRQATSGDGQWWRVENLTDGYRGWVRSWGLVGVADSEARRWSRMATARAARCYAEIRRARGSGAVISPLFWNGRVIPRGRSGRWTLVELPDGRRGWVESGALSPGRRRPPSLLRRLEDLLGLPYLWGGRTPLGFDCSGFVQQVLAEQGIRLPRDADDQYRAVRPLGRSSRPKIGDLVFFGPRRGRLTHVGLVLGEDRFVHAHGWVKIGSFDHRNELYDNELSVLKRAFGRPVRRPPWGP